MRYALLIFAFFVSIFAKADKIYISNQSDFDDVATTIKKRLDEGQSRIDVVFKPGQYYFKEAHIRGAGWNFSNATINFIGNGSVITSRGNDYNRLDSKYKGNSPEKTCCLDEKRQEISGWSDTFQSPSLIEILDKKTGQCRIKSSVSLKDYSNNGQSCMSILITKWYLGAIYRVDKIKDSYVYFTVSDLEETHEALMSTGIMGTVSNIRVSDCSMR